MPYPDVLTLANALIELARAIVLYYVSAGLWDEVEAQWAVITAWFNQLFQAITDSANALIEAAGTLVGYSWATFEEWIAFFEGYADRFINWFEGGINWLDHFREYIWTDLYGRFSLIESQVEDLIAGGIGTIVGFTQEVIDWLVNLYNDALSVVTTLLGEAWIWVVTVFSDPFGYITGLLGEAWTWLLSLFETPLDWLASVLGEAWTWLLSVFSDPAAWLFGLLGETWQALVGFISDPLTYLSAIVDGLLGGVLDFWTTYAQGVIDFFSDPTTYILTYIRDRFLAWLEELIAENW